MRGAGRVGLLAGALVCLALASARADDGDLTLGVAGGYDYAALGQGAAALGMHGGGGGIALRYGVGEALSLQAQGFAAGAAGPRALGGATLGVAYSLDLLRVVPTFEAGLGVLGVTAEPGPKVALGLALGLSVDYVLTRRVALGAAVRTRLALSDPGGLPLWLWVGPQVSVLLR